MALTQHNQFISDGLFLMLSDETLPLEQVKALGISIEQFKELLQQFPPGPKRAWRTHIAIDKLMAREHKQLRNETENPKVCMAFFEIHSTN